MTGWAIAVPYLLALACVGYAFFAAFGEWQRRGAVLESSTAGGPIPGDDPRVVDALVGSADDRIAALALALLFTLVGTGAAIVDEKVDSGDGSAATGVVALDLSTSDEEHAAFTRIDQVHSGPLQQDLCLVRFYERSRGAGGPWWTDCGQGRSLETVGDARKRLALRDDWGRYDGRIQYTLHRGEDVTYLRGTVAPQCEKGDWKEGCPAYEGGGNQYFFPERVDPAKAGVDRRCAVPDRPPPNSAAEYKPC